MAVAKVLQLAVVSLPACGRLLGHARLSPSSHCSPPVPLTLLNVKSSRFKTDQKPKMVLTVKPSSRFLNRYLQTNGRLQDDLFCLYIQSMDLIQPPKSKQVKKVKVKKKKKIQVSCSFASQQVSKFHSSLQRPRWCHRSYLPPLYTVNGSHSGPQSDGMRLSVEKRCREAARGQASRPCKRAICILFRSFSVFTDVARLAVRPRRRAWS